MVSSEKIFGQLDSGCDRKDILDKLAEFYRGYGFRAFCFAIPLITGPDQFKLYERGMPQEWMSRYIAKNYGAIDPVPQATLEHGDVATLHEIIERLEPSDVEKAYLDEFATSGVTDGLVMPTTGLLHARGFFGIDMISAEDLAKVDRSFMHAVAQYAHQRIDRLELKQGDGRNPLSSREREILTWIAQGKSNPDIAVILGISEATVATHLKRIFHKLQVHDRVSAALAGFKLGVLR